MNELRKVTIQHFQNVLSQLPVTLDRNTNESYPPPEYFILEEREPSHDSKFGFNCGSAIRRWQMSASKIKRLWIMKSYKAKPAIRGIYYSFGYADFSFHNDKSIVRVGWQAGPRYGQGYDLLVTKSENGIILSEKEDLWIS